MARIGPVVMSIVGDIFVDPARISALIWEGTSAAGDTCELRCAQTRSLLWAGRANDTNNYQGASVPQEGIHAPFGFELTQLSSGRVLVYLREH